MRQRTRGAVSKSPRPSPAEARRKLTKTKLDFAKKPPAGFVKVQAKHGRGLRVGLFDIKQEMVTMKVSMLSISCG